MIAGYLGSGDQFDEAIGDYAVAYADEVERDYKTFVRAVRNGRLKTDLSPSRLATMLRRVQGLSRMVAYRAFVKVVREERVKVMVED